MKQITVFECKKCGAQFPKWQGRCTECGSWGTIEEVVLDIGKKKIDVKFDESKIIRLKDIKSVYEKRISSGFKKIDEVLGSGFVKGSLILLGGEPGIGKSTLSFQIASNFPGKVLYICGEESPFQIKTRLFSFNIKPFQDKFLFLQETQIELIEKAILKIRPLLVVVDSIQTISSLEIDKEPGSISQLKACTIKLLELAKKTNTTILLIGHITKSGEIAGPKIIEHLVDVVLYLEGERTFYFRILRSIKNRFGSCDNIAVLELSEKGFREIKNPSLYFISKENEKETGKTFSCIIDGKTIFFVEIQALVVKTVFGYPKRTSVGFDLSRLQMLIAVITKYLGINLGIYDVFLNVAGGVKIKEPSCDLAVVSAILSSYKNIPLGNKIFLGEVSLTGEIKPCFLHEKRKKEAINAGFKEIIDYKVYKKIKDINLNS